MNPEQVISVVIPARNAAAGIATLLRSLIPDHHLIREILLIDDGSEDATVEIAQDVAKRHQLPLQVFPVSFGKAGAARNFGLERAQGRFLYFVDADDELLPGALTLLATMLLENPSAGLAVGSCIRKTAARDDKIKVPHGYTDSCEQNVARYLANELWPIAMGSALFVTSEANGVRFPEAIGLDEDTCFWAVLLARVRVVSTAAPVLIYKLDEARMARRYSRAPRQTMLGIARAFRALAACGISDAALKQRIAWVALRIARQLIMNRHYVEAAGILRIPRNHPQYCASRTVLRYIVRIRVGHFFQQFGLLQPVACGQGEEQPSTSRRTLIVTVDSAAAPVSGADLRNFQNAASLARMGPVRVVSIRPDEGGLVDPPAGIEFVSVGIVGERSKSLSSWRCSAETRIPQTSLPRLLAEVRAFKPDTIVVEGIPLVALLKHLRPLTKRLILDMHNVESELAQQARTWAARIDAARIRRLERRALNMVDRVWVCSEPDQDRLIKLYQPNIPVYVVPNGVPRFEQLQNLSPARSNDYTKGPALIFVGHLGYRPNVVAAERLAREILPLVRREFPSARAIFAGRYPCPQVQALTARPGVEVHANPESLASFYEQAHVAVVPLSEGGGTRIKILEAAIAGLPVVATALAAEGLGLIDQEEIVLADSSEEIARQVIGLCRDPEKMRRQSCCAQKTVRLRFGPDAIDFAVQAGA
jgi:glycosyltransferase involved in cell wall biosynthesis